MIGIVIATHGDLAKGIHQAVEMFFGERENVESIGLQPDDSAEDFQDKIEQLVGRVDSGQGILILTDLNGGTPFNRSLFIKAKDSQRQIEVFSGVNLPMVMDGINHQVLGSDLETAIHSILEESTKGIQRATLCSDEEDEDEF